MEKKKAIVLYDGYCRLCNGAVRFLINRDKKKIFHFEPLQSEIGQQILNDKKITEDSVVLVNENSMHTRSDAFIEMVRLLPAPWNWLRVIKYLPKKWRDSIYDFIARNRFRWFGKKDISTTVSNQSLGIKATKRQ